MFRRAVAYLGLGAILISVPLSAAVPPAAAPRSPTGKWVVDFDDTQCVASRNYGTEAQPLFFGIKAPIISDVMQLMFVRPGKGGGEFAEQLGGTIALDGGMAKPISAIGLWVPKSAQRVVRVNLPTSEFMAIAGAKVMDFRVRGEMKESIALSNMPALVNVLNKCVADLRRHWNVEPGVAARLASSKPDEEDDGSNLFLKQGARGDLTGVFRADDFPSAAIAKDMQGTVSLAMLIDESGKVADCTVVGTSGSAALDGQSCYIVSSRARFKPAIGLDGKPARSAYTQRVTWRLSL